MNARLPNPSHKASNRRRRASVLAAALVCLVVVMAILGQMLLTVALAGRQLHVERNRRQCELLLEAGIARAVHRRTQDAEYSGETWTIPSEDMLGLGDGQVTIEFTEEEDRPALRVVAEYPAGSEQSVCRSQTLTLPSPTSTTAEE